MHTQKSSEANASFPNNIDKFQQAFQLHQQGQLEQAERYYQALLKEQPQHIDALHFSGVLANQLGKTQQAVDLIAQSIELAPNNAAAHSNLGLALQELKRFDEALASYDRALALKPNNAEAHNNRANALKALKRFDEALASYEHALALKPDYAEAFYNQGNVLQEFKRYDEALASYQHALAIQPDYAEALAGCGIALQSLKRPHEALVSYGRAVAIKPNLEFTFGTWLHLKMNFCDWDKFDQHLHQLAEGIECGEKMVIPFSGLAMSSSAALQQKAAAIYTQAKYPSALLLPPIVKRRHAKIKIAYFSTDFRHHAVAYLTAGLFGCHDRSRFEVIAFSLHDTDHKDDMRLRLEAGFDQFIDVSQQSDEQIVQLARQLEIDIAIDLNGCTEGCRTHIFALRAAPIQVSYLGYSGTMGADYIDYIIADSVLIPTAYRPYYTEKIAYLPHSYMVNDRTRAISNRQFTRSELGLPEQGFVFCCFNNTYKITPDVFAVWMRLLHQVEGSVLWLSEGNADAVNNLQNIAIARGIAANRLIFAKRLPLLADHLARHRLADLFLDTLPYNAHTTSSDALWSGLPIVTCVGAAFASRVAASLLSAIGLSELITSNHEDYEALAIKLATHPEQLAAIKQKLADNRLTYPLFDTKLFTGHIESAYQAMFERYQKDTPPDDIYVSAETPPTEIHSVTFQQAFQLHQQGQLEQAERYYQALLKEQPQHIDALHFSGVLANQLGKAQHAVNLIAQSIELAPNNAAAHSNLGLALQELKRFDEALASYDRALALKPNNAEAYNNRANALKELKRFDEALASYDRALVIKPDYIEALSNRGMVLRDLGRLNEALSNYEHILAIQPDSAEALFGCGVVLQDLKRFEEAIISYERALSIKSDLEFAFSNWLYMKMNICDWDKLPQHLDRLAEGIKRGEKIAVSFSVLAMSSSAELQQKAAEIYTLAKHPNRLLLPPIAKHCHKKIKLGYFSSDFRHHAVSYLTAELFERHDRTRFEVIAFSFHETAHKDEMRLRLEAGFDQFIDVSQQSDEQIVQLARQLEIDIAIDLNGCTEGCRTDIFAMRVAPIQVSYLGYLGTMGADYMDYLLADSILIPADQQIYYHEKIAYLPHSFQVNDSKLAISDKIFTRTELGLPEHSFVFCCFNNAYKITPTVFDSWMRILQQVAGSVLWLLGDHASTESNLRQAAKARGIHAERLVFASRVPMPEYLARHRVADLFLDTGPYNAGATASAALWAGLPILTCLGDTFASRMGASLLNAIGLPELITGNLADYEALAIKLATHPEQLAAIKQKLTDNRLTYPLFNTALFTQNIEAVYQAMFDRYQADLSPDSIEISTQTDTPVLQELTENNTVATLLERANQLQSFQRFDEALACYEQVLSIQPDSVDAYYNRANLLLGLQKFAQARTNYDHVVALQPNHAEAYSNRAIALQYLGYLEQALASYERALTIKPDYTDAHYNRGTVLRALNRFEQAIDSYQQALKLNPDYDFLFGTWLYMKMSLCDWRQFDKHLHHLIDGIAQGKKLAIPFFVQVVIASPALQKKATETFAQAKCPSALPSPIAKHQHPKIKIGYFSADFRQHPVAYLIAELFELHDRSRFEIIAFSFHKTAHKDDTRLRLEAGFDQFIDVSQQSDEQIVQLARQLEIDIAVDLNGFTDGCRVGIFALRAAPIQVSYLGYLGTMGVNYMDYLLADSTLIPVQHQIHYNEKIAYLPHSFQVNDSKLRIANKTFTRSKLGLPEQGFVFCCFNNVYKITPTVFDSWMRILQQVDGSVLWLLGDYAIAEINLRQAAKARGIDAKRLVFAQRLAMPEYLARHRVADLFLDTAPYNAGATASAALWSGLPVLTCLGESFAGRMGASLLNAVGLPELITHNLADYEALAVDIATHPEQLAAIKQKLADNRLTCPLFDTKLFTQNIESIYQAMYNRYQADTPPDHIDVSTGTEVKLETDQPSQPSQPSPNNAAQFSLAMSLHQQGQLAEAETLYEQILQTEPQHAEALHFLGVLKNQQGQAQLAVNLIQQSLKLYPNNVLAYSNLAGIYQSLQRFDEALLSYEQLLILTPDNVEALLARSSLLLTLNRLTDALASYDELLTRQQDNAEAFFGRGMVLQLLKRHDEAVIDYNRALAINPDYQEALIYRGMVLQELKRFDEAIDSCGRALTLAGDIEHYDFLFGDWLHSKMAACDWQDFDENLHKLIEKISLGKKVGSPFVVQALCSSISLIKQTAEIYSKAKYAQRFSLPPLEKHTHSKIKLGYFSSDFRNHPVAYLMAELFERHDRSRFEVIAFSLSPMDDKDKMRLRLEAAFDEFIDVSQLLDAQIVELARQMEIDIAIDLNGYTKGNRSNLFVMRLAPIQAVYLGYLGTMGADYMDYLLADSTLIPVEHQSYYHEKIVYLPHSFQVNDSKQPIANCMDTRSDLCLPENGFVFCCFNNTYKITPETFDIWMRILHQVEGSVLWLLEDNATAETNLRQAAKARGIDAQRVIFAKRLPVSEHLARHCHADLFLDTQPCNAGATASSALWAGLPILTCLGDTFASRMGASLLNAIGLQELITDNLADYEALAVKLATHPEQLATIKQKLAANRLTYPLFDTKLFTQHIEAAYQAMVDRYQKDTPPDHIYVSAQALPVADKKIPPKKPSLFDKIAQKPAQILAGIASLGKRKNKATVPATVQAHIELFEQAQRLYQQGQFAAAEVLYQEVLKIQPDHAEALRSLTMIKKQRQPAKTAAKLLVQPTSNAIDPNAVEALINRGNELEDLNRLDEALESYDKALAINPNAARAHSNRGNALQSLKRFDEAIASYDRALVIKPDYPEAFYNRGNALQSSKRLVEAIASYQRALSIKPDFIQALISLGNALHDCKRFSEALSSYERVLAIQPDHAETFYNRGNVLHDLKRYGDALESYNRALAIKPDHAGAHWNSSFCSLILGDFDAGWKNYEWRWKTNDFKKSVRHFSKPQWSGETSLQGKTIFLYGEQGLGDTLHFCRYAKQLADLGARIILEAPKPLSRLLANLEGVDQLLVQGEELPAFDFHSPLLSLPLAQKTRLDSIPVNNPYLFSEPDKVKYWQTRLGAKTLPRVGLVWSGNAAQKDDYKRSLALRELLPLLSPHCEFISLQKELRATDKELLAQQPMLQHYGEQLNDFTDTAALIELMDVVISVCTSVAHLSAAMGKPTWILLSDNACWRWLLQRDDSPWYPTVRLFRQSQSGDWQGVIEKVKHELIHHVANANTTLVNNSDTVEALINRGNDLEDLNRLDEALASYDKALAINPDYARAHSNRGNVLQSLKRFDEALASYDRALAIRPDYAEAHYNRGNTLQTCQRFQEAIASYDRALAIKPDFVQALISRGNALHDDKRFTEALSSYDLALNIAPDNAELLRNRGNVLIDIHHYDEALDSYNRALNIQPDLDFLFGLRLHIKMILCDWRDFNHNLHVLEQKIAQQEKVSAPVFVMLLSSSAALQKKASEIYVQVKYPPALLLPPIAKHRHTKIKIAYFSSDFRNHPLANLTAELFERHNRSRFEVIAFSFSPTSHKDAMRLRLEAGFDSFIDVRQQSDEQVIQLARQLEIDIAVDLNGFTANARPDLFAMRLAPIQVSYLGYVGTMSADYIDYLIADSVLIPTAHQVYYSEKIAYLPNSFQVSDSTLRIADKVFTRAELDLPEQGFVFCCFNNSYKITPNVFDSWMRLLQQVKGSVLWLLGGNPTTEANLRHAAQTSGIAAERLIFAKRLPMSEHLARHQLADLFLDTAPYNAGATASAALWAGVPVLTYLGEAFASRMAASLLTAVGLPELITANLEDYEALAIQLATHPEQLAAIKQKLADNRLTYPLFDTKLFTQHIEAAYQAMFDRYQADTPPEHIYIAAQTTEQPVTPVIDTDDVEALINHGNDLEDLNRLDEALASYDKALAINPNSARAHSNRGNVLQSLKRFDDALHSYDRALVIRPEYAEAFYNRGNALQALERFDDALASYDRALAIKPSLIVALIGRGNVLQNLQRYDEALDSYDRALTLQPDYLEVIISRGNVLQNLKRFDEAILCYDRALAIRPDDVNVLVCRYVVLQVLSRFDEALADCERVLALKADHEFLLGSWLHTKMKTCDWHDFDNNLNTLTKSIIQGKRVATPFAVQALSLSTAVQNKAAEIYAEAKYPTAFLLPALPKHHHDKIKLGYFSSDFRQHPVSHLTTGLFEQHDRTRFEVIAFSFHATARKDEMRLRLETLFDQFIDVSQQSDEQVVQLARQLEIDIAIDLNGFTEGCRANLFALRVAPIQAVYLGYLGTMGTDYMDYLLADSTLIPVEQQFYYHEKIAYLPHSFQVNDNKLPIADVKFTRAELGLPEHGFVFCCFNNNFKITPVVFDSWMRILQQVDGSVLWLLGDHATAEKNLRQSATARGVEAARLVFAKRLPMPEYLARHRVADLFLDTSPYNAGATASAALWSGLPVLTCLGETYASRMAASLLKAVGLPELITRNLTDYEALAIKLATHPEQLADIKQKLANNRLTYPLFDTALFTQHIESAYQTMFDRYQADLSPDHIYVSAEINTLIKTPPPSQPSPDDAAQFQQAMRLHQQGQLEQAAVLYEQLLKANPQHIDALHFFGVLKNQQGQPEQGIELIQQSIKLSPDNAAAYSNLAAILQSQGRLDEALLSYEQALTGLPDDMAVLLARSNLLLTLNRLDDALSSYDQILAIRPDAIEVLLSRGAVLQMLERFDEALSNYERLLIIDPHHAEALFGQANVLFNLKRLPEAISSYERSLAINPHSFEVCYNQGVALGELNRTNDAIASYQQALAIKPDYAEAYNNLGLLFKKQHNYVEAESNYRHAIAIKPDYAEAHNNLITLLKDRGQMLAATECLNIALTALPDSLDLHIMQLILTLPMVLKTTSESALVLQQFDTALTALFDWMNASPIHSQALAKAELLPLPFLLAYRVDNHVQRLSRYGDLVTVANQPIIPVQTTRQKLKMVIVSHHFRRHSVWDVITRGLLVNLDRSRFEIILYHLGKVEDAETEFAKTLADKWRDTHTMTCVADWLAAFASDTPDIIFYPEIGMDPLSARLAAHRLAPLQMASWGHPITTGLPTIDLYFSGELLEAADADSHYRERLIRLPNTGCCTTPINIQPKPLPELEAHTLERAGTRFIIAQTIYKFDPADDGLYADIANAVGDSCFILLRDREDAWAMDQIVARLEQAFVDRGLNPQQHLLVLPWQSMENFQSLLDLCDVYLDCPSFSGYTTAWQAVQRGLPIITLEGKFMRQRLAAGLLRKIGMTDTIADSREDYIQCAAKLAEECRNPMLRSARRDALKTAAIKADNDVSVVRAFEQNVLNAWAERKA